MVDRAAGEGSFEHLGSSATLPATPPPASFLLPGEEGAYEDRRRPLANDDPSEVGLALELPGLGTGVVTGVSWLSASAAESSPLGLGVLGGAEKDSITSEMNKNCMTLCVVAHRDRGEKKRGP